MTTTLSIAIIGLGLIGGSLAEVLSLHDIQVLGYDPALNDRLKTCPNTVSFPGTLCTSLEELLNNAHQLQSIIVVAVPYPYIADIFSKIAELTQDTLITDVTSVKTPVHALAKQSALTARFIGGHPMSGTQDSGWKARNPALFNRKKWVITLDEDQSSHPQFSQWTEILDRIGALRMIMPAAEHDRAVAAISHLPHILAEILAVEGNKAGQTALELAASSFADGTRVAHTKPELVQAMLVPNQMALLPLLEATIEQLQAYQAALSRPEDLKNLLTAGQQARLRYEDIQATDSV